jgi:hypothetical protein
MCWLQKSHGMSNIHVIANNNLMLFLFEYFLLCSKDMSDYNKNIFQARFDSSFRRLHKPRWYLSQIVVTFWTALFAHLALQKRELSNIELAVRESFAINWAQSFCIGFCFPLLAERGFFRIYSKCYDESRMLNLWKYCSIHGKWNKTYLFFILSCLYFIRQNYISQKKS